VGTVNIGSRAPACPLFIVALHERGLTAIQDKRPQSGHESDWFPIRRSGDHIPNIPPLDLHISSLLDNPLIHKSVHRAHCIMIVSYVLSDTMITIHFLFQNGFLSRPALYIQNHRLSLKSMSAKCSLNTLGGKPFVSGSTIIFLVLICSRL
jgi:hypothetical protein